MLVRVGFISNSSSTSFVIDKEDLSKFDIQELENLFHRKCEDEYFDDNVLYETKRHFYGELSNWDEKTRNFFAELRKRGIEIDEDE